MLDCKLLNLRDLTLLCLSYSPIESQAQAQLQVSPQLFAVVTSITIITMVYVGGMSTIYGAIGGALLLTLMTELLRNFGEWRLMVYSVALILILFFLPQGLVAPTWAKIRQRLAGGQP